METDPVTVASLTLTHVNYVCSLKFWITPIKLTPIQNPSDPFSYLSAWLALVPQALCVVYVSLIWASREIEILLMFAGQMACEMLNFGLKRYIREERPPRKWTARSMGWPVIDIEYRNVRERIWDAVFTCPIRYFLLLIALAFPSIAPCTQSINNPYSDLVH